MNKKNRPTIKEFKQLLREILKTLDDYDEDIVMNTWDKKSRDMMGDIVIEWKDAGFITLKPDDIEAAHVIE